RIHDLHLAIRQCGGQTLLQHPRETAVMPIWETRGRGCTLYEDAKRIRSALGSKRVVHRGRNDARTGEIAPPCLRIWMEIFLVAGHGDEKRIVAPHPCDSEPHFQNREKQKGDQQRGCPEKDALESIHLVHHNERMRAHGAARLHPHEVQSRGNSVTLSSASWRPGAASRPSTRSGIPRP